MLIHGWRIRWIIRHDLPDVLHIEQQLAFPLLEDEVLWWLRQRNFIGHVAELGDRVCGYMIYELGSDYYRIARLAVDVDFRRHQCGSALVEHVQGKTVARRRNQVVCDVPEESLDVQLLLRSCGFRAIRCDRSNETYRMQYGSNVGKECVGVIESKSRPHEAG